MSGTGSKIVIIAGPNGAGKLSRFATQAAISCAEMAVARVAKRVRQGGHDIAEAVIRWRFVAGRANFDRHYRAAVDSWAIYDNAGDEPVLIEWGERS